MKSQISIEIYDDLFFECEIEGEHRRATLDSPPEEPGIVWHSFTDENDVPISLRAYYKKNKEEHFTAQDIAADVVLAANKALRIYDQDDKDGSLFSRYIFPGWIEDMVQEMMEGDQDE